MEITNIRAAQREGRDLLQDLEDIKAGITVVHESDAQKRASEEKKERRRSARELEEMREKKQLEAKNSPVQLSVFDLMD